MVSISFLLPCVRVNIVIQKQIRGVGFYSTMSLKGFTWFGLKMAPEVIRAGLPLFNCRFWRTCVFMSIWCRAEWCWCDWCAAVARRDCHCAAMRTMRRPPLLSFQITGRIIRSSCKTATLRCLVIIIFLLFINRIGYLCIIKLYTLQMKPSPIFRMGGADWVGMDGWKLRTSYFNL